MMWRTTLAAACVATATIVAPQASADPDTDFTNQLHIYGIYGQKDYNAWIAKLMCKRLRNGLDADAYAAASFVHDQLIADTTTEQAWQFVGAAVPVYCGDQAHVLTSLTEPA